MRRDAVTPEWSDAPRDTDDLEERLSHPDARVCAALEHCPGDVIVLGAGGKMGPSLTRMLQRAADQLRDGRRIIAVSRFGGNSDASLRHGRIAGSEKIIAIGKDLTSARDVASLPRVPNVFYMAGQKFGTASDPSATWAMNAGVPALVANHFSESRVVAFSTGNVYAFTAPESGGSAETDTLSPLGEYATSCLARERVFSYYAVRNSTPTLLLRLNYAVDLRYGVIVDIALKVMRGEPIDVTMGHVNVIWQGDANRFAISALTLADVPAVTLNVTGRRILRVREVAQQFGELLGRAPVITGVESSTALLSNTDRAASLLGECDVPEDMLLQWVAAWVSRGGEVLNKPTHFEVRDGKY